MEYYSEYEAANVTQVILQPVRQKRNTTMREESKRNKINSKYNLASSVGPNG